MEVTGDQNCYNVGVLVVSDTVFAGEKKDTSGLSIIDLLKSEKFFRIGTVESDCVADNFSDIEDILKLWADTKSMDIILTVGGSGFSPRDVTPEATRAVIDREAPHLASRMVQGCYEKSPFSVLSRSVCGMRGQTLILNLPGSVKGSTECFEVIANILPHALDQLKGRTQDVTDFHTKIQEA